MPTFTPEKAREIGEEIGINWDEVEFDSEALAAGMEVELEHGTTAGDANVTDDDPEATAKIAWAHLVEHPDYYVMLATMEDELAGEPETEDTRSRQSYMETKQPVSSKETKTAVELSPGLQAMQKQYLKQVVSTIESGESTDDAFKQRPDLDSFTPEQLLDLLLENPHLAKRQINTLGPAVQYGDLFDAMQATLELAVWEAAVLWWGQQRTKEQTQEEWEAPVGEKGRDVETVVRTPSKAAAVRTYRFRGHRYQELSR